MSSNKHCVQLVKGLFSSILCATSALHLTSAIPCKTSFDSDEATRSYNNCSTMLTKGHAVSLAWTYESSDSTLHIAFSGELETNGGWLGWGINPNCTIMPETSAMIAYRAFNGSNLLPYRLGHRLYDKDEEGPQPLRCSPIDIEILEKSVHIVGATVIMHLSIKLGPNQTRVSQVWGQGSYVEDFVPSSPCNPESHNVATLDVHQGVMDLGVRRECPDPNFRLRKLHILYSLIGFGVLYPLANVLSLICHFCSMPGAKYIYTVFLVLVYLLGIPNYLVGVQLQGRLQLDDHDRVDVRNHNLAAISIFVLFTVQVIMTIASRNLERRHLQAPGHGEERTVLLEGENVALEPVSKVAIFCGLGNMALAWVIGFCIFATNQSGTKAMDVGLGWVVLLLLLTTLPNADGLPRHTKRRFSLPKNFLRTHLIQGIISVSISMILTWT